MNASQYARSFELPISERDRRYRNIREEMKKRGLDCLLIWGSSAKWDGNSIFIQYISQIGGNGEGPMLGIFPLDQEPTIIMWANTRHIHFFREWAESQSWVTDLRPRSGPKVGGFNYGDPAVERIKELKLEKAKFGVVSKEEEFPYSEYMRLAHGLPDAKFESATDMMMDVLAIRSPLEIDLMEKVCTIGEKGLYTLWETAKPGIRENVVYANIVRTLLENGSESTLMLLWEAGAGVLGTSRHTFTCGKVLRPGDVVQVEIAPRYRGYYAQVCMSMAIGETSKLNKDLWEAAKDSFENALRVCKPGISGKDLWEASHQPIIERGFEDSGVGFHGIGMGWCGPSLTTPVLKAGLTMAFESRARTRGPNWENSMNVADIVLLSETGCRRLSKYPN